MMNEISYLHLVLVLQGVDLCVKDPKAVPRKPKRRSSKPPPVQYSGVCVVLQLGDVLYTTTAKIDVDKAEWHEEFVFERVCGRQDLVASCVNRLKTHRETETYDNNAAVILNGAVELNPGFIGQISIPVHRLPENGEKIEQWYQVIPKDSVKTSRAILKLGLRFVPDMLFDQAPTELPITAYSAATLRGRSLSMQPSREEDPNQGNTPAARVANIQLEDEAAYPAGLVDYVIVVGPKALSSTESSGNTDFESTHETSVLYQYPADSEDFTLPTKVEWFCFPAGLDIVYQTAQPRSKTFTFVLVGGSMGTSRSTGICLVQYSKSCAGSLSYPTRWIGTCIALITRSPMISQLEKCLSALYSAWVAKDELLEEYILQLTAEIPIPIPGTLAVEFPIHGTCIRFALPKHDEIPCAPVAVRTLFRLLGVQNVIKLIAMAWCECRILIHSSQLELLGPISEAICELLYPFHWQHPFVPILPKILSEYLQAPVPFIIGIQTDWMEENISEGTVVVDLDAGCLHNTAVFDITLPLFETNALYRRLCKILRPVGFDDPENLEFGYVDLTDESIYQIRTEFICYITSLLHGYKDCLFFIDETLPVFNKKRFFQAYDKAADAIPFLTKILQTQAFEAFLQIHRDLILRPFHAICQAFRRGKEVSWPEMIPRLDIDLFPFDGNKAITASTLRVPLKTEFEPTKESPSDLGYCSTIFKLRLDQFRQPQPRTFEAVALLAGTTESELRNGIVQSLTAPSSPSRPASFVRYRSTEESTIEESLQRCMANVFSSDQDVSQAEIEACMECFESNYGRDLFVLILTQFGASQQSGSCLSGMGFTVLTCLSNSMLEYCALKEDFTNVYGLLVVSSQYYTESSICGEKQYLQQILKTQPICQSLAMWQHAFRIDDDFDDQVFFSQIGSLVYEMLNVDVPVEKVKAFVTGMCSTYRVNYDLKRTLEKLVENVGRAVHLSANYTPDSPTTNRTASRFGRQKALSCSSPLSRESISSKSLTTSDRNPILCLSSNEKRLVTGRAVNNQVNVWDRTTMTLIHSLAGHTGPISSVQFHRSMVFSASHDATIRCWDVSTASKKFYGYFRTKSPRVTILKGHTSAIQCMELGPQISDKESVIVSGSEDKTIRIWHSSTESEQAVLTGHTGSIQCLRIVPHHDSIASGSTDSDVRFWDMKTSQLVSCFSGHSSWIRDLQVSGDRILSASTDRQLKVWDIRSGQCMHTLEGHLGPVTCVSVGGPADPIVLSGSSDSSVKIWDLRFPATSRLNLTGHDAKVTCVQRDFSKLISGSDDGNLRIWNLHTGQCMSLCEGHVSGITCATLGDGGACSASWDGTVRVWAAV